MLEVLSEREHWGRERWRAERKSLREWKISEHRLTEVFDVRNSAIEASNGGRARGCKKIATVLVVSTEPLGARRLVIDKISTRSSSSASTTTAVITFSRWHGQAHLGTTFFREVVLLLDIGSKVAPMKCKHPEARTLATKRKLNARVKAAMVKPGESMAFKDQEPRQATSGHNDMYGAVGQLPRIEDLSLKTEKPKGFGQMPLELLDGIFSFVSHFPSSQLDLCACSYISRSWYRASARFLYRSPRISGRNFDQFVRTICPSVNAHIRTNGLSEFVRVLDMSRLVHNGSRSLTARILGRLKGSLEYFVAPQASFASVPSVSFL